MAQALVASREDERPAPPDATIAFYDGAAGEYAQATLSNDLSHLYPELLDRLPAGGLVLDAGSGSGRDTLGFLQRGFRVEAFDASAALATLATRLTGVPVDVGRFEDWVPPPQRYDGIWCFASLLHVVRGDLPGVLLKLARAMRPGGWFFASFKGGNADGPDELGRHYTNMTVAGVRQLFGDGNLFRVHKVWEETGPAALGGATSWVYVLVQRHDLGDQGHT